MSSRKQAGQWMKFCKHMREAIIDEQKAVPDYKNLIDEAEVLTSSRQWEEVRVTVLNIIEDEKKHKRELLPLFNRICPRMAVHRKGLKLFGSSRESFDPSAYGAVITSEGIYTRRRRRKR